jgi:hypothetical protein
VEYGVIMVVSGGIYIYGIKLTTDELLLRLLEDGYLQITDLDWFKKRRALHARFKHKSEDGTEDEDEDESLVSECYHKLSVGASTEDQSLELFQTPHECRWTDIEGSEVYFGETIDISFGYGKLEMPVFEHKSKVDELAAKYGCVAVYLFTPNDCNCCS